MKVRKKNNRDNAISSSIIKKNINNDENILKYFSTKDSTNNILKSKKVNNLIYQNFISNANISKPFMSTKNSFYSSKTKYSNQKLNDFPLNYYTNPTLSNIFSRSQKSNDKLTVNTNYNYIDNSQNKKIFKINNKIFIENLKFKNNKKNNKDYTDLLISKTETQYPLSTYYISPIDDTNYSVFNSLFSSFRKSHSNSNYKNNLQEIKKNDVIIFPGSRRTFRKNRSESENKIIFSQSNNFNNLNYSCSNKSISNNNSYCRDLKNEFLNIYKESKRKYFRKRIFYLEKNIKKVKYLALILINTFNKKMFPIKKEFFLKIYKKINPLTLTYSNINDYNNCLFPKLVNINRKLKKNKDSKVKFNITSLNNIKINKKSNNRIYFPKIAIKNNSHLSTIYSSINNNRKPENSLFENKMTKLNRKTKFKRYTKLEKNNIKNKILIHQNVLSLDISNDNSLKHNIFSEKSLYTKNKNNNKLIYETKKGINERNSSFGKIYQKKLRRNNTNKIFPENLKISLNNKAIKNKKKNLNINNGMLIDYIISNDEKLYIIIKYVVLINNRKNNLKYLTSFNQSYFKIDRIYYLNIIKNVLTTYSNKEKETKINNSGKTKNEIITNDIIKKSNKKGQIHYKKEKKYFMDYLKIKSFCFIFKKNIFLLVLKKILNYKIINIKSINNNNSKEKSNKYKISKDTIINYNYSFNNENKKLIRVKKAKKFKNINNKIINKEMIKEVIINIIKRRNTKIIKKYFKKWKEGKRIYEPKIIKNKIIVNKRNNFSKYKQKLISVLKNDLFLIRFHLITFSLKK